MASVDTYPPKAAVAPCDWKKCQVKGCTKVFQTFKGLLKHLDSGHFCAELELEWVRQAELAERRGARHKLTGKEATYVELFLFFICMKGALA
jgi:hypothetical protein